MKTLLPILLLSVSLLFPAHAQWTVYDPAVHSQMIVSTAEEVAKFVEMIGNQVKQIQSLTEQASTLHHYVDLFGNPGTVVLDSVNPLMVDLRKAEVGLILGDMEVHVSGTKGMVSDGGGLFPPVGVEFKTPQGVTIARRESGYRPVAAVQDATVNFVAVSKDTATRRASLKHEIASATEAIRAATTDAEVQKLTAVLVGLSTALSGTDHELSQATASVLVQDVANRTDERRQTEAKDEQKRAEFAEGLDRYGKTFRLWSAPVAFPIK